MHALFRCIIECSAKDCTKRTPEYEAVAQPRNFCREKSLKLVADGQKCLMVPNALRRETQSTLICTQMTGSETLSWRISFENALASPIAVRIQTGNESS